MSALRTGRIGPTRRVPGAGRGLRRAPGVSVGLRRLPRLLPTSNWRQLLWLLVGLLTLALLGVLAVLSPDPPEAEPPSVTPPHISAPRPSAPKPSLDAPRLGAPELGTPSIQIPTPSLPRVDSGGGDQPTPPTAPAGPEHRTELIHDHHRTYLWLFDWLLVLLALAALAVLYPFARLPRQGQRVFGGMLAAGLLALSVAAFAAGINPQSGPGTYEWERPEVERSDEAIVKYIHVNHFHEPVFLDASWLLLGLGLAALAVPGARVAVRSTRKGPAAEGAAT